jgi:hypothetical protein
MLLKIYVVLSTMVFVLAIGQFWKDPENPKAKFSQWLFLAVAMLLSPIVLPNMLVRRFRKSAGSKSLNLQKLSTLQCNREYPYSFKHRTGTDDAF